MRSQTGQRPPCDVSRSSSTLSGTYRMRFAVPLEPMPQVRQILISLSGRFGSRLPRHEHVLVRQGVLAGLRQSPDRRTATRTTSRTAVHQGGERVWFRRTRTSGSAVGAVLVGYGE